MAEADTKQTCEENVSRAAGEPGVRIREGDTGRGGPASAGVFREGGGGGKGDA